MYGLKTAQPSAGCLNALQTRQGIWRPSGLRPIRSRVRTTGVASSDTTAVYAQRTAGVAAERGGGGEGGREGERCRCVVCLRHLNQHL
jgi:hypothetical protein